MRSRYLLVLVASVIAGAALQGCSSEPPKNGIAVQPGDYLHAPGGGGGKPGAPPAGKNPNKA
jgi:hypothetical protein